MLIKKLYHKIFNKKIKDIQKDNSNKNDLFIKSCKILYIKENRKIKNIYNNYYKVDIYFKDKSKISVVGFIDTGNNLYDPYKKRPIILLSNKYIREDNYILVPYYTMSGEGLLKCIKPDIIFIDGIGYRGNILIGFSESPKLIDGVDVILHKDIMKG